MRELTFLILPHLPQNGKDFFMKELTVGKNDAGQRLDRFVAKAVPLLPASLLQKYIRLKRLERGRQGSQRSRCGHL